MRILTNTCPALLVVLCSAALSTAAVAASPVLYRFTNDAGEPVYSYTLPPGQAGAGYQKIDRHTGQVLESVEPELGPRELAAKQRRERVMRACRAELDRIYRLYGTETDIEDALQKSLAALDTRIGQLQGSLTQADREHGRLRDQAADAERVGREIPPTLLNNIERSRARIDTLQAEIEQRRQEQDEAQARYARELERFRDGSCPEPGTLADAGGPAPS